MEGKNCNFCQGDEAVLWKDDKNNAFVDSKGEMQVTAGGNIFQFNVRFCPMCGRSFSESENYLDLKPGDDIYYVDEDMGDIEHGKITSVTFENGKVDAFGVEFDESGFDEIDGRGLGRHYFRTEQKARAVLTGIIKA